MHRSMVDQLDPLRSNHIEARRGVCLPEDAQGDSSNSLCIRWLQDRVMNAGEYAASDVAATEPEEHKTALTPIAVLRELFELLEDYAPTWYSEESHRRAETILKTDGR